IMKDVKGIWDCRVITVVSSLSREVPVVAKVGFPEVPVTAMAEVPYSKMAEGEASRRSLRVRTRRFLSRECKRKKVVSEGPPEVIDLTISSSDDDSTDAPRETMILQRVWDDSGENLIWRKM
ncbi:hypothetical protein Dimus_018154, partial [Dionaea muscipula]